MESQKSVPSKVYRYRRVNSWLPDFITKRMIYFSSPQSFNDPYDCLFQLDIDCSYEEFREAALRETETLQRLLLRHYSNSSLKEAIKLGYRDRQIIFDREKPLNAFREFLNKTGLFCVSTELKSLLMWSHYADHHRGVCVELITERSPAILQQLVQVEYLLQTPRYPIFERDKFLMAQKCLCVKSKEWSYENEWRVFGAGNAGKTLPLERGSISCVYLGARISSADEVRVIQMVKQADDEIQVMRSKLKPDAYELEFVPVCID